MKKKIILGLLIIIILGAGIYTYKFYKDYQDFHSLRAILDKNYFSTLQETSKYLEEYSSFNNDLELSDWQVDTGLDENLKLRKIFEESKMAVIEEDVEYENAVKLKENVLITIPLLEDILADTYNSDAKDDEEFTSRIELLDHQIKEMNLILEEN